MAVGRTAIFSMDVAINQDLKAIFPHPELLSSEYLFHFLRSSEKALAAKSTGSTVKGIRLEDLEQLHVVIPSVTKQKRIAEILSGVDEQMAALLELEKKYVSLKSALSSDLLSSRKRVSI